MLEKEVLERYLKEDLEWIKNYAIKTHAKGVVVGNSGGKDSAVVIAMMVNALGKDKVLAVSMPCNSIDADFEDAKLVADTFGVKMIKVDLSNSYNVLEDEINNVIRENLELELITESKVNMKPRMRMLTLYSIAQSLGYLVAGTGNLCEQMVGYTTKWGDNASDFNPIASFTVDEVLEIGRMLNVPDKIINKAPSDGLGLKTDEEKMGIKYSEIAEMIETGTTENEESKKEIIRRFNAASHKRSLVPAFKIDRKNYLLDL